MATPGRFFRNAGRISRTDSSGRAVVGRSDRYALLAAHAYLDRRRRRTARRRVGGDRDRRCDAAFERVKERLRSRRAVSHHTNANRNTNDVCSEARHLRCLAFIAVGVRPHERSSGPQLHLRSAQRHELSARGELIFAGKAEMLHGRERMLASPTLRDAHAVDHPHALLHSPADAEGRADEEERADSRRSQLPVLRPAAANG